jgi:hypothetical protein
LFENAARYYRGRISIRRFFLCVPKRAFIIAARPFMPRSRHHPYRAILGRNRTNPQPRIFDPFEIEGGIAPMKKLFGFLAMAGLMLLAAPVGRAQAMTLLNPAASAQTKYLSDNLVVEVRHRGGGFRGGGFRGRHFGGGPRFVHHRPHYRHHRPFYHRPYYVRRHVWRPRPVIYPYYYAQPRLYCRKVWTDFGPRRICRHRPWWV